jgi:hypothetical protein
MRKTWRNLAIAPLPKWSKLNAVAHNSVMPTSFIHDSSSVGTARGVLLSTNKLAAGFKFNDVIDRPAFVRGLRSAACGAKMPEYL